MTKSRKNEPKKHLTEEDTKPENWSANVTIRMEGDVLEYFRAEAKKLGIGYQTAIKRALRKVMEGGSLEDRVSHLEKVLKQKAI
jgi:uncharacterized protein (DUF4415 family)